jgi:hypothetical protein
MSTGDATTMTGPAPARRARWTETERNWIDSVAILVGSVLLASLIYALEMHAGRWNAELRVIYTPSETVMRLFGVSHVLIATLYLATSRSMRTARSWAIAMLLAALGVTISVGFWRLDGISPALASLLFFLYFGAHDFRDQVFFYFEHNDAPPGVDRRSFGAALFWMPLWALAVLGMLAAGATLLSVPGTARLRDMALALPPGWRWSPGLLVVGGFAVSSWQLARHWRLAGMGTLAAHLRANRPIHVVFAGTILLALLAALPGWGIQLIVILHVTAWYVFTVRQLRRRGDEPRRWSWSWLRTTPAGFRMLHLGTLALLTAAAAAWAYGFRSDPALLPLWVTLDVDNFAVWTLLHVTVSFRPR